jgi:RimJ/RimL family protein N-acetyltransferase
MLGPVFHTERLILRPVAPGDVPRVQAYFPHWEVVRYLNARIPWPYPEDGAAQFYHGVVFPAVAAGDKWVWAICLRQAPDALIGVVEFNAGRDEHRGFWLGAPWQGQGFMTEACEPLTDFWFDVLRQPRLVVGKAVANAASSRVSVKQNARLIAMTERDFLAGRLPTEVWELTRADWNARRRALYSG